MRDRGDITLWINQDAIDAWRAPMTGKRGAQPVYADIAIETALALHLLFHLPLPQTEGFLGSVLRLMGLSLPCPDHTTLSRRYATVTIQQQAQRAPQGSMSVIVDSTGLKVCGRGEWHAHKHGDKKRRRWKKLHLGVDDEGCILASCVTDGHEQDPTQVPELLYQIDDKIDRFVADGIYDQEPVYTAVEDHSPGARVIIPPRKNAALSRTAESVPTPRDEHLVVIERHGVFAWKRMSGYYAQSHAENAFARYKRMFGSGLRIAQSDAGAGWSGRQGCNSSEVKVPTPSIVHFGWLAYPKGGEATNCPMLGRKSHSCPDPGEARR